ncbi:hypothetical protein ABW21_db0207925 [Orbilia brochopaga]|nr:hypothetical protein ABW21_db0207925 [Drechslerella brochopaga]
MGQASSVLKDLYYGDNYQPYHISPDRPPHRITLRNLIKKPDRILDRPNQHVRESRHSFWVDFNDPESLERELRRCKMAGIIVWTSLWPQVDWEKSTQDDLQFYAIMGRPSPWGEDTRNWPYKPGDRIPPFSVFEPGILYIVGEDEMPTSMLNEDGVYSAVYPAALAGKASLAIGGDGLREHLNVRRLPWARKRPEHRKAE